MDGLMIAPTEPSALRRCGLTSPLPERNGVDLLWASPHFGLCGVQRKELRDLVASMQDGRLAKEVSQMNDRLGLRCLLVEGRGKWGSDGTLMDGFVKVTRRQVRAFLWSIRSRGVWVEWTDNLNDTIETVGWLMDWTRKGRHTSLSQRPGPTGMWGKASDREWAIHLLTGFEGIGAETAAAIIDHFGGVPLRWEVDEKELLEVKGVGKVRAKKMIEALKKEAGDGKSQEAA